MFNAFAVELLKQLLTIRSLGFSTTSKVVPARRCSLACSTAPLSPATVSTNLSPPRVTMHLGPRRQRLHLRRRWNQWTQTLNWRPPCQRRGPVGASRTTVGGRTKNSSPARTQQAGHHHRNAAPTRRCDGCANLRIPGDGLQMQEAISAKGVH